MFETIEKFLELIVSFFAGKKAGISEQQTTEKDSFNVVAQKIVVAENNAPSNGSDLSSELRDPHAEF
jgi:hypothetical protein